MSSIRPSEGPHELRVDLPAAHSAGRMARQMLRQFALREGVPEKDVQRLEFVAGELLDNAVDHGGGEAAREESDLRMPVRVSLVLFVGLDRWVVRVGDQGGGSPEVARAWLAPREGIPDLEDERGRGFFLLMQMVDTLLVEKSRDGLGLEFEATCSYPRRDE